MPRISQSTIDTIKHQVNLVDVVSPYVQLKRAGRSYKGLSPFTQEKTPSFYVHPDRGFYKCFSTDEGGDHFTFIMKVENLEFGESIEFLAKKFNIPIEYEAGGPSREEVSLRKQLFEIHELATAWFHHEFIQGTEAEPVRNYWTEQRGFDMATAEEVKIGYAPAKDNALALLCQKRNISTAAMHQSGLFFAREQERDHSRFRSRFRGRLMVPIRDVQGRVVAFTARQLEQTPADDPAREAKYVNSPETPIFHKGRILFGIDHARTHLKDGDSFLLVEGQLDAIRCWSVGLHTAVAPQGTALTEDQVHLMRRYDPASVECLMDGDAAGRKAALRYIPIAFKAGMEFRFLMLPEKADPDDLLRQSGAAGLDPIRAKAKTAIELAVQANLPHDRAPSTHEKTTALRSIYELLHHVPSEVAREDYIQTVSRLINVDSQAALKDFKQTSRPQQQQPRNQAPSEATPPSKDPLLTHATWELLWLLLHFPEHGTIISQTLDYDWINTSSREGQLLARITAEYREGLVEDGSSFENLIENIEERKLLAEIHTRNLECDFPKVQIQACLNTLYKNYLTTRKKDLEQAIRSTDSNSPEMLQQMREVKSIRKQLTTPLELNF